MIRKRSFKAERCTDIKTFTRLLERLVEFIIQSCRIYQPKSEKHYYKTQPF